MSRARLTILMTAFILLTGFLGWQNSHSASTPPPDQADESYQYTLLYARVVQLIRQDYVDESKTSYKDLTYAALRGMLSSLDPHSQFLDEESFQDIQRETKGEFSGLGIVIGIKDNALVILSPMEDSPGGRAGLLPGDRILKINGRNTEKMTLAAAEKALKGETGEKARLTLLRPVAGAPGGGTVFDVELTRETIRVASVKDARLLPATIAGQDKIGYIRIEEFGENTSDELDHALEDLEHNGMQALVIDLRNNPGGLLDSAVDVAGKFLPPNTVIVSTRGRTPDQEQEFRARPQASHPDYPIALLINGYSASGAEIVAGALKDLNRAILVGETTFGKGSVQTVQSLGNGVGLRLTTAKYYTPAKKTIHEVGITPDIEVPITDTEERRVVLAEAKRPLSDEEKAEAAKAEDRQLERAVDSLRSIRIYDERQAGLNAAPKTTAANQPPPRPVDHSAPPATAQ
ncbi:MAG: S41 family peptidase [Methylacidiphilales bacterium]|nr:S41 family peptidase [Candidatus Methylacidiphilales bacterium]